MTEPTDELSAAPIDVLRSRTSEKWREYPDDVIPMFVAGKVAEQGGPELADRLEDEGYDRYLSDAPVA